MSERSDGPKQTTEPTTGGNRVDHATETFVAHRNLLFTVAYEMLGSAADAEDVLQETWLRWMDVDQGVVRDPRAYLIRVTTRQALMRLRSLRRRKETYVGPWLPEPLLTAPDVAEDIELAEGVSMAMLLVMETLTPTERAVFVLREVFGLDYDEIAEAVDKPPVTIRQIAHRARKARAHSVPVRVDNRGQQRCHQALRLQRHDESAQVSSHVLAQAPSLTKLRAQASRPLWGASAFRVSL